MTKEEQELQELTNKDWQRFKMILGEDNFMHVLICMYRQQGRSYTQISIKLNVTYDTARYHCEKCPPITPSE